MLSNIWTPFKGPQGTQRSFKISNFSNFNNILWCGSNSRIYSKLIYYLAWTINSISLYSYPLYQCIINWTVGTFGQKWWRFGDQLHCPSLLLHILGWIIFKRIILIFMNFDFYEPLTKSQWICFKREWQRTCIMLNQYKISYRIVVSSNACY